MLTEKELKEQRDKINPLKLVRDFLIFIGEDPDREGLLDTPKRIVKSWKDLYGGYFLKAEEVLKTTFVEGSCKEMVMLKDIPFVSFCEHHNQIFTGNVSIGYLPDKKVVGVSKLIRLVNMFAQRLQIQEKFTSQIADTLMDTLKPLGCMVVVTKGTHYCMVARGVKTTGAEMVTSAIRGNYHEDKVRQEFLQLLRS